MVWSVDESWDVSHLSNLGLLGALGDLGLLGTLRASLGFRDVIRSESTQVGDCVVTESSRRGSAAVWDS